MEISKDELSQEMMELLANPRKQTWYALGQAFVNVAKHILFHWDVAYHAPMPTGSKILVSNHPTTADPILMIALVPEQIRILIIDILFKVPVVGASLRKCRHIRVDQGAGRAALDEGLRALEDGATLGIFPEGVISPAEGGLAHFHSGAARMALESGKPVVPVGIAVQREKVWRKQTRVDGALETSTWYTSGIYAVTVGETVIFRGRARAGTFAGERATTGTAAQAPPGVYRALAAACVCTIGGKACKKNITNLTNVTNIYE